MWLWDGGMGSMMEDGGVLGCLGVGRTKEDGDEVGWLRGV